MSKLFKVLFFLLAFYALSSSEINRWQKVTSSTIGGWAFPALVYAPNTNEYIVSMGGQHPQYASVYQVQVFTDGLGKWINAFPHDSLYGSAAVSNTDEATAGKWGDSTGTIYGYGMGQGGPVFGWPFYFTKIKGYLRPNPNPDGYMSRAYTQFCYNNDDGKIYYYIDNMTFTYDPATRLWDTLSTAAHPNGTARPDPGNGSAQYLKWGSLCYDRYNHEVVLFGGGAVDMPYGHVGGTWTFNPTSKTWTKLNLTEQPSARAHSPMVYDSVNRKIVLFGGDHLDYLLNDTWVYDCVTKTWAKMNPTNRPKPRAGHALLYMPKSKKVVLLGGYRYEADQSTEFEMWRYDIATNSWDLIKRFGSELWPKLQAMKPGFASVLATNKGDTLLCLGDSTLYNFVPHTYQMACDPTVTDAIGTTTYGLTKDTVALRSGFFNPSWYNTGVTTPDTAANENTLRNLTLSTWTKITPPKTPGGERAWGSAAYDPDRDLFMRWAGGHAAYCGTDIPQYSFHNNRWNAGIMTEFPMEYDRENSPAPGPFTFNDRPFMPMHPVKSFAYDPTSKLMVYNTDGKTYLYNPDSMDWVKDIRISGPNKNDPYRAGLCSTPHGVYAYWAPDHYLFNSDSLKWRKLSKSGVIQPNYYADATGNAYDSKRDRMVYVTSTLYSATTLARVYTYDFQTGVSTQLFPADSSITTGYGNYRDAVYLPTLDVVLFPIHTASGNLAYDCANNRWIHIPIAGFQSGMDNVSTAMMYDPKRNIVWLTDGASNVYAARLDAALTANETKKKEQEFKKVSLSPNPFNPSVSLTFDCNGNQNAFITVLDPMGKIVQAKSIAVKDGMHHELLNLSKQASGVYMVQVKVNGQILTRRAMLLK